MRDSPDQNLLKLSGLLQGYVTYNMVTAAVRSGLVEALGDGPLPLEGVCERAGTLADPTARFLDLLRAYGLVGVSGGSYFLMGPGTLLVRGQVGYSHAILMDREFERSWSSLDSVLRDGKPILEDPWRERSVDTELGEAFGEMFSSAQVLNAGTLMHVARISRFRTVCDVGGGVGMTLISLLERNRGMTGKVQDLAYLFPAALRRIRRYRMTERAEYVARSFFDGVEEGMEAYLLQNVLQDWTDFDCRRILARCRAAMDPGAFLFVAEQFKPEKPNNLTAVTDVHLMVTNGGRKRTQEEVCSLLRDCGFSPSVLDSPGIGVVEARPA